MTEEGSFYNGTFEGTKPLPQHQSIEDYERKANPILEEQGRQIVKKSQYDLMKWSVIALGVIALAFIYIAFTDGFKSSVNIPQCPTAPACPQTICPSTNLTCPDNNCNTTCIFPSNLTIKMVNST